MQSIHSIRVRAGEFNLTFDHSFPPRQVDEFNLTIVSRRDVDSMGEFNNLTKEVSRQKAERRLIP